ncbi:probable methyltransferase At1g29790 isoform X2 [Aristolochia californica]|uniref:probable methyltransferase At1g29790 isoform X2 n=1 Tax=Aristolochia californica TaxID=171875 RepID=UPI0035DE0AE4
MGSVSLKIGDGTARFKRASVCSSALNVIMIFSVLTTNLFALYAFTTPPQRIRQSPHKNISVISEHVSLIVREIEYSQRKLALMEKELLGFEIVDISKPNVPSELKVFLQSNPLPLGPDSKTGITEMVASVGHFCAGSMELLAQYMNYKPGGPCPDDSYLAQKLILRGCEPLPRRRCQTKTIPKKWVKPRGKIDFLVDDVLAMGGGGIRIGFDIGGDSGHFAAIMAENNVTIITSTLNPNAPYSEFIAARGLFPLFLTPNQRFPFSDGVFDLVHTSKLSDGAPVEKMEFLMFDIDRILRVGGLFWLDNCSCIDDESKKTLTRLIEKFGYKKLRWVVGEKADSSRSGKPLVYLSAVLQKPVRL